MANASNNGLLPINNGQSNGQGGYSQVSPMFGNYYNISQAPTGNSVLGYNYGATGLMPGGVSSGGNPTPTPPSGGSMALGTSNSQSGGSGTSGYSSAAAAPYGGGSSNSGYSSAATGGGNSAYGAAVNYAQQNKAMQGPPVAAQSPAAPKYNSTGPLGTPQNHYIAAQPQANNIGQIQGSSRPVANTTAWANMQPQAVLPPNMPPGTPQGVGTPISTPTKGPVTAPKPPAPKPPTYTDPGPGNPKPSPTPAPKPKPKPAPPPSALDKWLAGDTTYQQQLAEYNQEQQAYNQNYTNTKNQISQNFDATQRSMNNQAALDRMNQQYDFAGRGVLSSGAYATALDQYNTQFQNNIANLVAGESQQNTTNSTNLNNFLRQLTLQKDAAKQDAIARRAALLGITS